MCQLVRHVDIDWINVVFQIRFLDIGKLAGKVDLPYPSCKPLVLSINLWRVVAEHEQSKLRVISGQFAAIPPLKALRLAALKRAPSSGSESPTILARLQSSMIELALLAGALL